MNQELGKGIAPGSRIECRLGFEPAGKISGIVREPSGLPAAVRLGIPLSLHGSGCLTTTSGTDGRFSFGPIGSGRHWITSLHDRWEVDSSSIELLSGQDLEGVVVVVHPRIDGHSGRAVGILTIGGEPPGEPVLLALDEIEYQHFPDAYSRGFAWTDAGGNFEISAPWPRSYHLVPKHRTGPEAGGWRDFTGEFPAHEQWPCSVDVPAEGRTFTRIELPPESEWDGISVPRRRPGD